VDIVDHRVPSGYAPPPHVHSEQDEVFYIISGQFDVRCGDQSWEAGPGDLVFLPRQVPHSFTVSGDGPGRTLLINAPAGFADVIVELGQSTTELEIPNPDVAPPSPDRIAAVAEAHGIHPA
jgi:mannose-6-phosphate isomerase-like protein (cupin superfamily)